MKLEKFKNVDERGTLTLSDICHLEGFIETLNHLIDDHNDWHDRQDRVKEILTKVREDENINNTH